METSQPMEKCQNCFQLFPETKINSHFSYCRRNIKKCSQCSMMVDINYQEDHDQQFHTAQPCQYCKKPFLGDQLDKHQTTCNFKPKYCEYCQLNIAVGQFAKHTISCGSRTNTCPMCEKHIMLKEFAVHQIQCKGKIVEAPQPLTTQIFKKKQTRQDYRQNDMGHKARHPIQVPQSIKVPSSYPIKEQVRKIQASNPKNERGYPITNYERPVNSVAERNTSSINPKSLVSKNVQPSRNIYKKQEPRKNYGVQVPKKKQQYKYQIPKMMPKREQSNAQKLYRQQKQYIKQEQQKQSKRLQYNKPKSTNVLNQSDSMNFDFGGEDLELQRILMESAYNKAPKYQEPCGFQDLGMDHMSQSFFRDVQQQQQIQTSLRREAPRRR